MLFPTTSSHLQRLTLAACYISRIALTEAVKKLPELEILNIREILRRLEVQTESLNNLKAMVKILMNERAVGKGKEKATPPKAPCSSDCKIVAFYRSPPSATPRSGRWTRRSPDPCSPGGCNGVVDAEEFMAWLAAAASGDG